MHDTKVSSEKIWSEFAHEHATIATLVRRYKISESTVQRKLDDYELPPFVAAPRTMVALIDATRVGYSWVLVVYDPHQKETVYLKEIPIETTASYQEAYASLTAQGFAIQGIVSDGRFVALPWLFPGIPVQMCHFHQEQIVIRYLTLSPKLPAGIELLELVRTLPKTDEASFTDAFKLWCHTWHSFLQEKSVDPKTGKSFWTHRRVRQARDSIAVHLSCLFTFQRFPELGMPNTTNALDGKTKKAKVAIGVHAGLVHARQLKLVLSILRAHD